MEYAAHESRYSNKGCMIAMFFMLVGIVVCSASIYVAADVSCTNDARTWLEDYPESELITEDYTFFRAFGLGETTRVLYTADHANDVRNWYLTQDRARDAEGLRRNIGIARMNWQVTGADDRDEGSYILLYSECAKNFVFQLP
jgi:hypothetical protein